MVQSTFYVSNLDYEATRDKLTRERHFGIAAAYENRKCVLVVYVKVPVYENNKITSHKKVHVQISPRNHINVYWDPLSKSQTDKYASLLDYAYHEARELRLALNCVLGLVVTVDGKPPKVIYKKRIPPLPAELKARRTAEYLVYIVPLILWTGFLKEKMKQSLKELKILIEKELTQREDFKRLKNSQKRLIINALAARLIFDYLHETQKSLKQEFGAWLYRKINNKLIEQNALPLEERIRNYRRILDKISEPILE